MIYWWGCICLPLSLILSFTCNFLSSRANKNAQWTRQQEHSFLNKSMGNRINFGAGKMAALAMKYLVFLNRFQSSLLWLYFMCAIPGSSRCSQSVKGRAWNKARLRLFRTLREMSERKKNIFIYVHTIHFS